MKKYTKFEKVPMDQLPIDVQAAIKEELKMFHECYVVFENGKYNVSSAIALTNHYAPDHRYIGDYTDTEVFTAEELMINFVETFHAYPIEYKGRRDYHWLNSLSWGDKVRFNEAGNLVSAK